MKYHGTDHLLPIATIEATICLLLHVAVDLESHHLVRGPPGLHPQNKSCRRLPREGISVDRPRSTAVRLEPGQARFTKRKAIRDEAKEAGFAGEDRSSHSFFACICEEETNGYTGQANGRFSRTFAGCDTSKCSFQAPFWPFLELITLPLPSKLLFTNIDEYRKQRQTYRVCTAKCDERGARPTFKPQKSPQGCGSAVLNSGEVKSHWSTAAR